jgi:hypothetical protein
MGIGNTAHPFEESDERGIFLPGFPFCKSNLFTAVISEPRLFAEADFLLVIEP